MTARPIVSVVVPVYNGSRDLPGCLASIGQAVAALGEAERASVEVIVCDNWSTDASPAIAAGLQLDCAYRVMRPAQHEANRTRNWRAGFAAARGEWMMMLHADDLMAPSGLAGILRAVARPEARRAAMITGRHRVFEDPARPGPLRPRWTTTSLMPGSLLRRAVLPLHCPFVPFVLMRREAYERIGGLDERWELVQDWELWMRLTAAGDVLFVADEIGWWRSHPTSPHYREVNAREHVALSHAVPGIVRPLPAGRQARVERVALARAAVQLDGVETDPSAWLGGERLPTLAAAEGVLSGMYRTVAARLLALRALGVARRLPPLARELARQH